MTGAAVARGALSSEIRPKCHRNSVPAIAASPQGVREVSSRFAGIRWYRGHCTAPTVAVAAGGVYNSLDMRRPPRPPEDPKRTALRAAGALHPHPDAVQDATFRAHAFFDPRDWVQVRYELLRRHRVDGRPVTEVAQAFGVSRQAIYHLAAAFAAGGLPGLLPRKRGPKAGHKATPAVLDFVAAHRASGHARGAPEVAAVARRFGVTVHPRSLDRALARREKKRRRAPRTPRR